MPTAECPRCGFEAAIDQAKPAWWTRFEDPLAAPGEPAQQVGTIKCEYCGNRFSVTTAPPIDHQQFPPLSLR